jgi:RNA recognition motif. (a.k.a. RRM, RBD, or RNP domain)
VAAGGKWLRGHANLAQSYAAISTRQGRHDRDTEVAAALLLAKRVSLKPRAVFVATASTRIATVAGGGQSAARLSASPRQTGLAHKQRGLEFQLDEMTGPFGGKDSRTCFVRNLPYGFGGEQLTELFAGVGPVKHAFVVGEKGGAEHHKGYGFVSFALAEHAAMAAAQLAGHKLGGRVLQVRWRPEAGCRCNGAPSTLGQAHLRGLSSSGSS